MKLAQMTVGPIVGAVTPESVRLWGRGELELTASGPRRCFGVAQVREHPKGEFGTPKFFKLNPNFDMTGLVRFTRLKSDTLYEFRMAHFFSDAELEDLSPARLDLEWDPSHHSTFITASDDVKKTRSFVFGSCRYLLRLFGGNWLDDRGDKTFRSILDQIEGGVRTDQLLMIGDQIYADDLNFAFPDRTLDEYNQRYRTAFSQPYIKGVMSRTPTYMTLDDHEIEDNWPAHCSEIDWVRKYPAAMHAYLTYQASHSPLFDAEGSRITGTPEKLWYTFEDGCCEFFITDTRTERLCAANGSGTRQLISAKQMEALKRWLAKPTGRVKLIVSAVPFFPDLAEESTDKWSAFEEQRSALLDFVREKQVSPVIVLSGDVHASLSAELVEPSGHAKIVSIVSSPFFWPYPHLRAKAFRLRGNLTTKSGVKFDVAAAGPVHSTDNFTRLTVTPADVTVEVFGRKGERLGKPKVHQFSPG